MKKNQNKGTSIKSGFTLIEATFAMVLLGIAAAGILLPFANAAAVQAEGARQTMAAYLASELMEITLQEGYAVLSAGYSTSEDENQMKDANGDIHSGSVYRGFSRDVTCQSAWVGSVNLVAVTVTVYFNGNEMTQITTLAGNRGS